MTIRDDDDDDYDDYDEFGTLGEAASEIGLVLSRLPAVTRRSFEVAPGQMVSAISWGDGEPELAFLHGGGQNAHTWDTLLLALGRPAIAIDLPGHGRSDWRSDRDYGPWRNAESVAVVLEQAAPNAAAVVGMSLGGMTTIRLAATRPDLVRRAVIVDISPGVNDPGRQRDAGAVALIAGPPAYDSFEAMAQAAVALSPRRPRSAVERGVRNNAVRRPDGTWSWRYDLFGPLPPAAFEFSALWEDVSAIAVPVLLVRAGSSPFVGDDDVAEYQRRLPGLRAEVVADSGHAVQSDQPLALAGLVERFAFG